MSIVKCLELINRNYFYLLTIFILISSNISISMAITKTASRNVAFKVAKMRDSIMEDQDELIIRKSECEELGLEANTKAVLEDVGHNADLYIANQEDNTQN